ncbi:hypothetical protein [Brucella haematophila]|jgi:hypothetical protein|uniref:Uncharacterized protein n=1 Tax=Brucella haematophila TaxID=419474 RepID=A0ABX1DQD3_9HYPH|nr:hypothetical protein [Brucella haematophila]NKC05056.1 hypothetical protein [Brucella haematophila]TMV04393.1 hypothetical protein FGI60_05750 [Brucella haematophila]
MGEATKETLFKQPLTRMETKNATTDKTAKAILEKERAAIDAKTERLRAARLERDHTKFSKE